MDHAAAILSAERALMRRGVAPASAADAARSAWLAAWERGGRRDNAPGLRGAGLYLAARRLSTPGRGGASRGCAPLHCADPPDEGGNPEDSLVALIDAAKTVGRSPLGALAAARRAGASLADIGAACGVSGETARLWALGRIEPCLKARERLCAFLEGLGT